MIYGNRVGELVKSIDQEQVKRYMEYWMRLKPRTNKEVYERWLFSFMSVHTTWRNNVKGFELLKDMSWVGNREALSQILRSCGAGLHKMRTKGIWEFTERFWNDPGWWNKRPSETWLEARTRLSNECNGLGLAKTAFALEMCFPDDCGVCCLDTHVLKLYGKEQKVTKTDYLMIERHWVNKCAEIEVPSPIVRNIYWDRVQQQTSLDYWAKVFE